MTTAPPRVPVRPPPIPVRLPRDRGAAGILRDTVQLAARSILMGAAIAVLALVLGVMFGRSLFWAPMILGASVSAGVGAAAVLVVCRALRNRIEWLVVPLGGLVLSIPSLMLFGVVLGAARPVGPLLWVATAIVIPAIALWRGNARPVESWRPVIARAVVAFGAVAMLGVIGFVLLSVGFRPSLVIESTGTGARPADAAPSVEPMPRDEGHTAEAPLPTIDEARRQFAALADAAAAAAGDVATWSESSPLVVTETACDGGVVLNLDGEFTTGVITDTTSDEHDREVTERNLAAAQRIVDAWEAAGLGGSERLHDEPVLGGGALGSVQSAKIDFAFGIVLPRVDGRCVPVP